MSFRLFQSRWGINQDQLSDKTFEAAEIKKHITTMCIKAYFMKHGLPSKYVLYISLVSRPETHRIYKQMDNQIKNKKYVQRWHRSALVVISLNKQINSFNIIFSLTIYVTAQAYPSTTAKVTTRGVYIYVHIYIYSYESALEKGRRSVREIWRLFDWNIQTMWSSDSSESRCNVYSLSNPPASEKPRVGG